MSRPPMLATLSSQINAEHAEAERSLRASVEHAIRCGELLLQAKREIGHGNWTGWLQENITFSDRLAQAYMRLARLPVEKRNAVADLPLREALSAIRSRQKLLADAEDRISRPLPVASALLARPGAERSGPPPKPLTTEEIADDLVQQLHGVMDDAGDAVSIDDVRSAFERRFGDDNATQPKKSTSPDCSRSGVSQVSTSSEKLSSGLPTGSDSSKNPVSQAKIAEPNPITVAWIEGTWEQRNEFIDWLYDDAPAKVREWLLDDDQATVKPDPDDGLDLPDYLKRAAP